jgi:hypothetical protein
MIPINIGTLPTEKGAKMTKTNTLPSIIILGSIWGFIEATLGMLLHITHLPFTGVILGSFGLCFMYFGWKLAGNKMPVAIASVAASFKIFDSLILGIPFLTPMIFKPFISIVAEGLLFSGVTYLLFEKGKVRILFPQRILISLTVSIVCMIAYLHGLIIGMQTNLYFLLPNFFIPLLLGLPFSHLVDFISVDKVKRYNIKPIIAFASYVLVVIITVLL